MWVSMTSRNWLSRFSSFWIYPLLAVLLLFVASRAEQKSGLDDLVWLMPVGILIWTLLEYGLHRFVFHIRLPVRNPYLREIVNASHLEHHASPRDRNKVLVRPLYGLIVSATVYALLFVAFRDAFSAAGVLVGIWSGFLYYEAVHYRVHFSSANSGIIALQRRGHFYHHFTNNKRCFGVTSPLWDYVFGTTAPQD